VIAMAALTAARHPAGLLFGLGLAIFGWRVARAQFAPLLRGWLAVLPFLVILALLQVVFRAGEGEALFNVGPLAVTETGLFSGLMLVLRFSAFIAVLGLSVASLSTSETTRALESLLRPLTALRVPVYDFVMIVQVTLRFFPLLAQTAERIAKAQASRGADWQPTGWNLARRARQVAPLLVPLFVNSLRRSESVALAMDSRAYGVFPSRGSLVTLRYHRLDWLVLALAVITGIVILFL
jgi:energy-coupling factor transport system permease protein